MKALQSMKGHWIEAMCAFGPLVLSVAILAVFVAMGYTFGGCK